LSTGENLRGMTHADRNSPTWTLYRVAETGSTNTDLVDAAAAGAPHGTVLVADHQTAGRGRLDRQWDTKPGANLLVSVLFRSGWHHPHELTQRIALAAAVTTEQLAGVRPELKWPNDLLIGDAKLAGILAQVVSAGSGIDAIVVGMGLNLGWAPDGAARLDGVGRDDFLYKWLGHLAASWYTPVGPSYRASLATIGKHVRVERATGDLVGQAIDIDPDGALAVRTPDGQVHRIAIGDVHHLRSM
jgi:BirA family transcriptional regulator, biotin operon repressor / biotin---[acetyl-CoA-carboxylase] ligase